MNTGSDYYFDQTGRQLLDRLSFWFVVGRLDTSGKTSPPPKSNALHSGQRQTHVIRTIKPYAAPSLTLCATMGANKLPDFSRQ
jgi:hypothetical protein